MRTWDDLRISLAKAAYERDAHARWRAKYFTPWEMLHESVRTHYWDAQEWVMEVVNEWLAGAVSVVAVDTFTPLGRQQDCSVPLLDDGWEPREGSVDDHC
jgi:hypothetical protein